jgi:thiol-disulfide isomerase/thioredoxin
MRHGSRVGRPPAAVIALCLATLATLAVPAADAAELRPWSGPAAAPALALRDLDGREHRLADYKGKVVVINFWATWCEPCREEMPSLQRLADAMAGKAFVLLAVDMAEGEPRVRDFLRQMPGTPLRFPLLLDRDGAVARAWKVKLLPTTLIIDPAQRIRLVAHGDLAWDAPAVKSTIEKLLLPVK